MKQYRDQLWYEGRNSKEEEAKRIKSKKTKVTSIQMGIDEYFLYNQKSNKYYDLSNQNISLM